MQLVLCMLKDKIQALILLVNFITKQCGPNFTGLVAYPDKISIQDVFYKNSQEEAGHMSS